MNKKRMPLRWWHTDRDKEKVACNHYNEEFTESQAERIWKRDMTMLVIGAIIVLVLLMGGVI